MQSGEEAHQAGQLGGFQQELKEAIYREVFKELTKEEANSYTSPVNYTTIKEAFKPGSMSPIRICMNSSMKWPGTRLLLNDILKKDHLPLQTCLLSSWDFESTSMHCQELVKVLSVCGS